jgi:hypothetical protein
MAYRTGASCALFPNSFFGIGQLYWSHIREKKITQQAVIVCVGHATWAAVIAVAISTGFRGLARAPVKGRPQQLNLSQNQ